MIKIMVVESGKLHVTYLSRSYQKLVKKQPGAKTRATQRIATITATIIEDEFELSDLNIFKEQGCPTGAGTTAGRYSGGNRPPISVRGDQDTNTGGER